jgi:hypothetical protein
MSLNLSPDTEARLQARARERGLSIDELVESLIDQLPTPSQCPSKGKAPELPAWDLGVRGSLHRRDIYDDVG